MANYKELFDSIETVSDLIKICNKHDQLEFEKATTQWDYNNEPYTYLGNIGGDWDYKLPDEEDRIGIQCSFNKTEEKLHVPLDYTRGYDRHAPNDLCNKIIKFLRFNHEYQADVNIQPPNTMKVLHYDNMLTFIRNNKHLHDLLYDKKRRQPQHQYELKRIFVALTDWQDGWMFQMGTKQWSGWKKGDVIDFHWRGQPHSTGNASFAHRPLLKISGFSDILYFGSKTL